MPNWFTPNFEIASIVLIFLSWQILAANLAGGSWIAIIQNALLCNMFSGPLLKQGPTRPVLVAVTPGLVWAMQWFQVQTRWGPARLYAGPYWDWADCGKLLANLRPDEVRQDSCRAWSGLSWFGAIILLFANLSPTRSGKILAGPCRAWADCRDWRT